MINYVSAHHAARFHNYNRQTHNRARNDSVSIVAGVSDNADINDEAELNGNSGKPAIIGDMHNAYNVTTHVIRGDIFSFQMPWSPDEDSGLASQVTDEDSIVTSLLTGAENLQEQKDIQGEAGGPTDETQRLTRKLVAATTQFEVTEVISEVYKNLLSWQMAAAQGDEKAAAVVRRLKRLITRCNRKIRDLNKEDSMRTRQARAEKNEQRQLEEQIRIELRRAKLDREQRERRYLQEKDEEDSKSPGIPKPSIAATEAKIRALAAQLAQLSSPTGAMSASGAAGGETATGEVATDGSAEAAVASDVAED